MSARHHDVWQPGSAGDAWAIPPYPGTQGATERIVTSTIIGVSTMDQLIRDIDAFDTVWTDEIDKAVLKLHLSHPNPCP